MSCGAKQAPDARGRREQFDDASVPASRKAHGRQGKAVMMEFRANQRTRPRGPSLKRADKAFSQGPDHSTRPLPNPARFLRNRRGRHAGESGKDDGNP